MDNEYEKFEDLVVESSSEVYWAKTDEIELEWNGKKFTIRIHEN